MLHYEVVNKIKEKRLKLQTLILVKVFRLIVKLYPYCMLLRIANWHGYRNYSKIYTVDNVVLLISLEKLLVKLEEIELKKID